MLYFVTWLDQFRYSTVCRFRGLSPLTQCTHSLHGLAKQQICRIEDLLICGFAEIFAIAFLKILIQTCLQHNAFMLVTCVRAFVPGPFPLNFEFRIDEEGGFCQFFAHPNENQQNRGQIAKLNFAYMGRGLKVFAIFCQP